MGGSQRDRSVEDNNFGTLVVLPAGSVGLCYSVEIQSRVQDIRQSAQGLISRRVCLWIESFIRRYMIGSCESTWNAFRVVVPYACGPYF